VHLIYHSRCIVTTEPHKVASRGRAELDWLVAPLSRTGTVPCRSSRLYRPSRSGITETPTRTGRTAVVVADQDCAKVSPMFSIKQQLFATRQPM
jgi:hypothetical protein